MSDGFSQLGSDGTADDRLSVRVVPAEEGIKLEVTGEIDAVGAPVLASVASAALEAGEDLVLDLAGVRFCDSSGIRVLVSLEQRAQSTGRTLRLVHVGDEVLRLLKLLGIESLFTIGALRSAR